MISKMHAGRTLWFWGSGYLLLLAAVVWALIAARNWALTEMATPKSVREWQAWREDVRQQQSQPGPVARSVPKSDMPPALVLMRDYFTVSLIGAIVFSSVLYWVIAWFTCGILSCPADFGDRNP
jgi:hypothetical protein